MADEIKFEGDVLNAIKSVLPEVDFSKIDGDVTIEAINAAKSNVLITKDVHQREINAAVGRITGEGQTVFGRILGEAAKGKDYKELLPLLESRYTEVAERIKELESATPSTLTEKEKKELAELRKLSGEQQEILSKKEQEIEAVRLSAKAEAEQLLLNMAIDREYEGLNWVEDVSPFAKKGLRVELDNRYNYKREGDKILVFTKTGEIVKNTAGTGQMEAKELFEAEAKNAKLFKMNGAKAPVGGSPPTPVKKEMTPQEKAHYDRMMKHAQDQGA